MGKLEFVAVTVAVVLFAVGLIAVAALFLMPLLDHGGTAPTWVYALTPLAPVGFVVGIAGVVLAGRTQEVER